MSGWHGQKVSLRIRPAFLGSYGAGDLKVYGIDKASTSRHSLPDNNVFCGDILGLAAGNLALDVGGVQRGRYLDDKAGGGELRVKVGLDRDDIRDTSGSNFVYGGQHPDGKFHIRCGTVAENEVLQF